MSTYIAVLSLGSNIPGDFDSPAGQLTHGLELLERAPDGEHLEIVETSRVFATPPWGGVEQEDFCNITVLVRTSLAPLSLLHHCQEVEQAALRRRIIRWGPRTLDVDIVWLAREELGAEPVQIESPDAAGHAQWGEELLVPHPYAHQRAFVLVPWLDLECARQPWCLLKGSTVSEWLSILDAHEAEQVTVHE
ncbi:MULTISPECIES: 2-amino-4-hydroxy-6-hydroxymethyldihydropteridine diphosphokinase [Corynebacterium]|uniref:2-amino-4-hydroxy-6- hydroxymethyldihydropteridine diphosphokinase n=1 Tax=Corynebacterium TaxID=1716 RepID=UPI001CE40EF1|nr:MULTISPECIES: 2-amino-4-hydroxy-6-hydroxymethyldihydropteridine diphosphokinase [Corynebacterium]